MAKPKEMAARAMVETAIWIEEPALLGASVPVGVAAVEEDGTGFGEAAVALAAGRLPSGLYSPDTMPSPVVFLDHWRLPHMLFGITKKVEQQGGKRERINASIETPYEQN